MNFKITVDCLVFAYDNVSSNLKILLIKRRNEPAKGKWALPGGFVKQTEDFLDTALRKLHNETGAKDIFLEQLNAYSLTDPSPENRIVSVAFYAILKLEDFSPSDTNSHIYKWQSLKEVSKLPFDHSIKLSDAIMRIKERAHVRPIIFKLLPKKFTINQLHSLYEEIFNVSLDNRNFRRKFLNLDYIEELKEYEQNVSRRPGKLYSFNEKKFIEAVAELSMI